MSCETVAVLGSFDGEHLLFDDLAGEFGWSVQSACDLDGLCDLAARSRVVAAVFDLRVLGRPWADTLERIGAAAPGARLIVGQAFAEQVPWPDLSDRGAFHSFSMPFRVDELRQSLGFVWAARQRRSEKALGFVA